MKIIESIELRCTENSSYKFYKTQIFEVTGGYDVIFAYGRIGNTAVTGTKNSSPLTLDKAEKEYKKLINSKLAKGYVEHGSSSTKAIAVEKENRDTGLRPQLLNELPEEELEDYLNNSNWAAQEKYDGKRKMLIKSGKNLTAVNRKGLTVAVESGILLDLEQIEGDIILDGEDMGDYMVIFDIVGPGSYIMRNTQLLQKVFAKRDFKCLKPSPTAFSSEAKRRLYNQLRENNAEGIVFKEINSMYSPGRPNSGGNAMKFKFYSTASCMVGKINDIKRSISLNVFDENLDPVNVGNCTVYPNQEIPEPGSIVEVKYLYYFEGGSLFQPVLLSVRDDIQPDECTQKQLKYKKEEDND